MLPQPDRAVRRGSSIVGAIEDRVGGLTRFDALVHVAEPPRGLGAGVESRGLIDGLRLRIGRRSHRVVGGLPIVTGECGLRFHQLTTGGGR